jgi:hypothetical protein
MEKETKVAVAAALQEREEDGKENVSGQGSKKEGASLLHMQQKGVEETKTTLSALKGWLLF